MMSKLVLGHEHSKLRVGHTSGSKLNQRTSGSPGCAWRPEKFTVRESTRAGVPVFSRAVSKPSSTSASVSPVEGASPALPCESVEGPHKVHKTLLTTAYLLPTYRAESPLAGCSGGCMYKRLQKPVYIHVTFCSVLPYKACKMAVTH